VGVGPEVAEMVMVAVDSFIWPVQDVADDIPKLYLQIHIVQPAGAGQLPTLRAG